MKSNDILKKIPKHGFLKLTREDQKQVKVSKDKRVELIRKGNELFNNKKYDMAKRIFITINYSDGLIRLGEYYLKNKKPLEAFRMYWLANYIKPVNAMIEKMAFIIKKWLKEER